MRFRLGRVAFGSKSLFMFLELNGKSGNLHHCVVPLFCERLLLSRDAFLNVGRRGVAMSVFCVESNNAAIQVFYFSLAEQRFSVYLF